MLGLVKCGNGLGSQELKVNLNVGSSIRELLALLGRFKLRKVISLTLMSIYIEIVQKYDLPLVKFN